jgi:glycosyltransferase involved in cell wall biosynthesis
MATPCVTCIITNYNYAHFLAEAIDSVLAQTFDSFELIIVDDGSTDHSQEILSRYEAHGRTTILRQSNAGQAAAFNRAFVASSGKYVAFLDADDRWLPEKLTRIVEAFEREADASLVYHRLYREAGDGKRLGRPWPRPLLKGDITRRVLRSGGWWPYPGTSGLSFTREFLAKVMPIPVEQNRLCADAYLADLSPFFGRIVPLAEPLGVYRLHGANLWTSPARLANKEETRPAHLKLYEHRVDSINLALAARGRSERVTLEKHWPYQRLLWDSQKRGMSFWSMVMLALTFPAEPRLYARVRAALGVVRSRLLARGQR